MLVNFMCANASENVALHTCPNQGLNPQPRYLACQGPLGAQGYTQLSRSGWVQLLVFTHTFPTIWNVALLTPGQTLLFK